MDGSNASSLESSVLETPLGDNDKHLKIQLCLEFLKKEIKSKRNTLKVSNTKQEAKVLNVTISKLKNVPRSEGKNPRPFVKIRLLPDDAIHTTEYGRGDAQHYFESFEFPSDEVKAKTLRIEVCDGKLTRSAKLFGKVDIPLDELSLGKPLDKWYKLD